MANLDQVSQAIGQLQTGVEAANEKLDHLHKCLHSEKTGIATRLSVLERDKAKGIGFLVGLSATSGATAGGVFAWLGKFAIAKLGGG